jgi:hypothetical protein
MLMKLLLLLLLLQFKSYKLTFLYVVCLHVFCPIFNPPCFLIAFWAVTLNINKKIIIIIIIIITLSAN